MTRLSQGEQQQQQEYKDFEAMLLGHLKALDKAGKSNFSDWLTCQQALLQMRQTHAAEAAAAYLKMMPHNPFMG
jgi:hypothetical protein